MCLDIGVTHGYCMGEKKFNQTRDRLLGCELEILMEQEAQMRSLEEEKEEEDRRQVMRIESRRNLKANLFQKRCWQRGEREEATREGEGEGE